MPGPILYTFLKITHFVLTHEVGRAIIHTLQAGKWRRGKAKYLECFRRLHIGLFANCGYIVRCFL